MKVKYLLLAILTIALFSGCSQKLWVSDDYNQVKADIDTLTVVMPHIEYSEKTGETEKLLPGYSVLLSDYVGNILVEMINEGKFIPNTVAVRGDSVLLQKWVPDYFLKSLEKYEKLNKADHLFINGKNSFPVTPELRFLINQIETRYFLFVYGEGFGASDETKEFDLLQVQTHAILYDQAFSYDYQWNGIKLQLYIIDKNSDKILWYSTNGRKNNGYNPLRDKEIRDLCENLLKQR